MIRSGHGLAMTNTHLQKALRYRWYIFGILSGGYMLVYFHRLCPAVVAVDMMQDLKTGGALTGLLAAAYFYPYAVMQIPAGLLSDFWGPRRVITIFFMIASGGSVLLGFAPSAFWAVSGRVLVGIGVAMLFVPTMKILAEWFCAAEFAFMTGILMAIGGLGSLIAAAPLAWLSARIGWRLSFVVVGVFTLALAALVWLVVRDRPADKGWRSPAERQQSAVQTIALWEGVRRVIGCAAFWPLAVWFFCDCAVFFSFGGLWGGPYLIQIHHLGKDEASRVLSMMAAGMIVGSPLLSYLSNRVFRSRKAILVLSSFITLGITALLAFLTAELSMPVLVALCLGLGIFSSAVVVIGFTANKELFPVQMTGTATGMVNLFPFAGGAVFQPLLGYLLERQGRADGAFTLTGYQHAFSALFFCAVVALGASFLVRETLKPRER
jgi:sugar phosphate permease